jgi:hypothetical protein
MTAQQRIVRVRRNYNQWAGCAIICVSQNYPVLNQGVIGVNIAPLWRKRPPWQPNGNRCNWGSASCINNLVGPFGQRRLGRRQTCPHGQPSPDRHVKNPQVKRLFLKKSVRIEWAFFGHAPTGRGTFFIFAANFYPIAREGSPAGQRMKNFLPGKTSHAPPRACRTPT